MAKNPKKPTTTLTKKHLARQEREKQQIRWIIIGTISILVLVIGLILAGIVYDRIIQPRRAVAEVNGEVIRANQFQSQVRFSRSALIQNALQTAQFMQYFIEDPNTTASLISQLQQIQYQLDKITVGQQVIDRMVDDLIIRQEAKKRGITVSEEEITKEFQNLLGYFPEGTPTPKPTLQVLPTSTYTPLQLTASAPTATLEPTEAISETVEVEATKNVTPTAELEPTATSTPEISEPLTPTATLAPTLTPTPYTEEGYQQQYKQVIDNYASYGVNEEDLRYVILTQLLTEKLKNAVLEELDIPTTQEETWARHILVQDEQTAKDLLDRLENGEDWCKLASELSTDPGSKDQCGDLGWFPKGQMVAPFEETAFSLPVGEISEPVNSEFGWHVIWVLGREEKPLSESELEQLKQTRFEEWLTNLRESSDIVIHEIWQQLTPDEPQLPLEILQLISQYNQPIQPETPLEDLTGSTPEP
jgi:parvulin-like peptidyl-prolyl isomerase